MAHTLPPLPQQQTGPLTGRKATHALLDRIRDSYVPAVEPNPTYTRKPQLVSPEPWHPGLRQITILPGDAPTGILLRLGFKNREILGQGLVNLLYQINGLEPGSTLRLGQSILVPTRQFVQEQVAC